MVMGFIFQYCLIEGKGRDGQYLKFVQNLIGIVCNWDRFSDNSNSEAICWLGRSFSVVKLLLSFKVMFNTNTESAWENPVCRRVLVSMNLNMLQTIK